MSIKFTVAAAMVAAAAVPAMALAGFPGQFLNDYEATVEGDPSTSLGFDVHRVGGQRVADEFDLFNVPFSCNDGSSQREEVAFPDDSLPVVDKRFDGRVIIDATPAYLLKVEGVLRSGGVARGTMSLRTRSTAASETCYSGRLRWKDSG